MATHRFGLRHYFNILGWHLPVLRIYDEDTMVHILRRLSTPAGLPPSRRLRLHSLRHFAATLWLRNGVGLDQVRRLLGHASLHTTLRNSSLVAADLQQATRTPASSSGSASRW